MDGERPPATSLTTQRTSPAASRPAPRVSSGCATGRGEGLRASDRGDG
jgi:hypothetical protein